MLLFDKLESDVQRKIVREMYERRINAGDILIQEGDVGIAASELYVVKQGEFEVWAHTRIVLWKMPTPATSALFLYAQTHCLTAPSTSCTPSAGAGAAAGPQLPCKHEVARRHLWRGVAHVQRATLCHCGRHTRLCGLGA